MKQQKSTFGALVEQYDAARPSYPSKVIDMVMTSIRKPNPLILDLGCGTGISTRQLAKKGGTVVGCDLDIQMITAALQHPQKDSAYTLGAAKALPFRTGTFDAVTAFTAFHWFTDKKSVMEIKRVLKPSGVFCIIHPRHTSPHGKNLRDIIETKTQRKTALAYSDTDFEKSLVRGDFVYSHLPVVRQTTKYPLDTFMLLLQSYSVWNNVPETMRPEMLRILRKYFSAKLKKGYIVETRNLEIIIARPQL